MQSVRHVIRTTCAGVLAVITTYLGICIGALIAYSAFFPPITGVQLQREIESLVAEAQHDRRYAPVPVRRLNSTLLLAVIAGEDTRFFSHHGLDWTAIQEAVEENRQKNQRRGASTITQQLVKNLFLTTHSTYLRKGIEAPLALAADGILSKRRLLELYVNVIEWGPGVYGAEAAAYYHYGIPAARLSRRQAAALAACIPNPLVRRPQRVGRYQRVILRRMEVLEELPLSNKIPTASTQEQELSSDSKSAFFSSWAQEVTDSLVFPSVSVRRLDAETTPVLASDENL